MEFLTPEQKKKMAIKAGISLVLVSVAVGYFASSGEISGEEVLGALGTFSALDILVVYLLALTQVGLMIARMQFIVTPEIGIDKKTITMAVSICHALNMFVPAKAGEAVKAWMFSRAAKVEHRSLLTAAGLILADRLMDLCGLIILILVSRVWLLPQFSLPEIGARGSIVLWLVGIILAVAGWFFLRPHLLKWIGQFRVGLAGLLRWKRTSMAMLCATGSWSVEVVMFYWLVGAQGYPIDMIQAVFVLLVLNVAVSVPVSFANVGTYEASVVIALKTFAVPMAASVAVGSVHHLLQLAGVVTWSAVGLWLRRKQLPTGNPSVSATDL